MANSRKFRLNKPDQVQPAFERAIGKLLSRVCVSVPDQPVSIAVAYSGGLDSTVLLHLAASYAARNSLPLHAFHIHHGISPNADAWVEHCHSQARQAGVTLDIAYVELANADRHGIEQAARIARYAALGNLCRRHNVALLLTAHHKDDQAETVFLQLMRGAGLPGLSGMPVFQSEHDLLGPGIALGRPLLDLSRRQLEKFIVQHGLTHVTDESNTDVRYRRNAFRQDIAPVIGAHFPAYASTMARAATHMQAAQALLDDLAAIDLQTCRAGQDANALELTKMCCLSGERFDNLLRYWLVMQGVQLPSTARLQDMRAQLAGAAQDTHPFFDFGVIRVQRAGTRLELLARPGAPPVEPVKLHWHGEAELTVPEWGGKLIFEPTSGVGLDPQQLQRGQLTLRARQGQERLRLAANRPSRSLKNLFQESHIAARRRDWLPLLYIDDTLVFVAGLGMDARHTVDGSSIAVRWESLPLYAL